MPIITSTAGHAGIGRDIQIALIGGNGLGAAVSTEAHEGLVTTITNVTQFEYNQEVIDITQTVLTSATIIADVPRFWRGSIEFVRADDNIDDLIYAIEQTWYTTGVYNNGHMDVTITDPLGGDKVFHFLDVAIRLENGGTWNAERLTAVRLAWRASQRTTG